VAGVNTPSVNRSASTAASRRKKGGSRGASDARLPPIRIREPAPIALQARRIVRSGRELLRVGHGPDQLGFGRALHFALDELIDERGHLAESTRRLQRARCARELAPRLPARAPRAAAPRCASPPPS